MEGKYVEFLAMFIPNKQYELDLIQKASRLRLWKEEYGGTWAKIKHYMRRNNKEHTET